MRSNFLTIAAIGVASVLAANGAFAQGRDFERTPGSPGASAYAPGHQRRDMGDRDRDYRYGDRDDRSSRYSRYRGDRDRDYRYGDRDDRSSRYSRYRSDRDRDMFRGDRDRGGYGDRDRDQGMYRR